MRCPLCSGEFPDPAQIDLELDADEPKKPPAYLKPDNIRLTLRRALSIARLNLPVSHTYRSTDPISSVITAEEGYRFHAGQRERLLAALINRGADTHGEALARDCDIPYRVASTRFTELLRQGLIYDTGKMARTERNGHGRIYGLAFDLETLPIPGLES